MYLGNSVHSARIDDDVVLLDVRRGEYFCLANGLEGFDFDGAAPRVLDEDLQNALGAIGLLSPDPVPGPWHSGIPVSRNLVLDPVRLGAGEAADAMATYTTMVRRYYGQDFCDIVAYAKQARPSVLRPFATGSLERRVAAFRTWLPWAPFPGVCLFRSFMLLAYLRKARMDAHWVFGVRTWPFEAHCWLQHGDLVLDDTADNVRGYTPIFLV